MSRADAPPMRRRRPLSALGALGALGTRSALAVALAAAGLCGGVRAAEDPKIAELRKMSLADVLSVDISTGTTKFLSQAPAVAYVLTAEDISRLGARNLAEVLESIPGLNIYLQQGLVNSPIIDLRGSFSDHGGHILFLRDGRPLRLISQATMPEIFRLPVHYVDRIEIIRGPASALYGNDAMAGAVNIITKKNPAEVGARVGQNEDLGAWAGAHGRKGLLEWSIAVNTSRDETLQDIRNTPLRREYTQTLAQTYHEVDMKASVGDLLLRFWALNSGKVEADHPLNPRAPTVAELKHRHADANYGLALGATTKLQATATHTMFTGLRFAELFPQGPADAEDSEARTSLDLTLTESRFSSHRLRAGTGFMRERRFSPARPLPPNTLPGPRRDSRDLVYASVQDEYTFAPNWELTAGARFDRYSGGKSIWSPRVGLVWTVNPQLTAKLLHSTGFRAPSLAATGGAITNTFERMRNTEVALDYRPTEQWRTAFNVYRYYATDVFAFGGPAGGPEDREATGGELEIGWLATPRLRFEASASLLSAENRATGRRVPYTPRSSAKFAVNWRPLEAWTWNVRVEGYWDRARPPNDNRPALEDFRVVHTTLRFDATNNLTLLLSAHNLLNERAYIPILFPTNAEDVKIPERNISFQVEYRF